MAAKHNPGRRKRACKANYKAAERWKTNKVRRLTRVVKQQPGNEVAKQALERAKAKL